MGTAKQRAGNDPVPVVGETPNGSIAATHRPYLQCTCPELAYQRLRAQFDGHPVPTFTWQREAEGPGLILVDMNRAADEVTQHRARRFVGKSDAQIYPDLPEMRQGLRQCADTGRQQQCELWYRYRSTGQRRRLRVTFAFVPEDMVLTYMEDLTEQLAAQDRAQQHLSELLHMKRVAAVAEFAASLAHELSQPIGALMNDLQTALWIVEQDGNVARTVQLLRNAGSLAERAGQIVRSTRQLVSNSVAARRNMSINPIVESALNVIASEARQADVHLIFDAGSDLPEIRIDRMQIEQVVMSLARNAVEALAAHPTIGKPRRVTVSTREVGGNLLIRVEDTGPGIDAADTERVFEPFFTTRDDGLGMGLAICRRIAEAHGGRLCCGSNHDGGAAFDVYLPLTDVEEDAVA